MGGGQAGRFTTSVFYWLAPWLASTACSPSQTQGLAPAPDAPVAAADSGDVSVDTMQPADARFEKEDVTDGGILSDASDPIEGVGTLYYSLSNGTIHRVQAREGAASENLSKGLDGLGQGTRDRFLNASRNGAWLTLATDRFGCSSECLVLVPKTLARFEKVLPAGREHYPRGIAAVSDDGTMIVLSDGAGPHSVDLFVTRRTSDGWGPPVLLTADSPYAFNASPALTLDGQRVTFDCGRHDYPESGSNDACEVGVDGRGFRKLVGPDSLPAPRQDYVQNPREGLDGWLFEAAWPIGTESPETIWLLPKDGGPPQPIGRMLGNAVSPCPFRDGRFAILWLGSPNNPDGRHELSVVSRAGTSVFVLTPGIDVLDNGLGCSD